MHLLVRGTGRRIQIHLPFDRTLPPDSIFLPHRIPFRLFHQLRHGRETSHQVGRVASPVRSERELHSRPVARVDPHTGSIVPTANLLLIHTDIIFLSDSNVFVVLPVLFILHFKIYARKRLVEKTASFRFCSHCRRVLCDGWSPAGLCSSLTVSCRLRGRSSCPTLVLTASVRRAPCQRGRQWVSLCQAEAADWSKG